MSALANCTGKPAQRGLSVEIRRMMGLETAAKMLGGQEPLAEALAINVRSLRNKLSADRGVSDIDLRLAADALDKRAQRIMEHAAKLREEIPAKVLPAKAQA